MRERRRGPKKKGWALPDEPKLQAKKKLKLQLGCKPASGWARPKNFSYIYTTIPSHRPSV
jgi:hypothetical protein